MYWSTTSSLCYSYLDCLPRLLHIFSCLCCSPMVYTIIVVHTLISSGILLKDRQCWSVQHEVHKS